MSREIKFRAWDKEQKKMLYGVSIGTIKVWDENAPLISHEFSYSEDCIFEQYTGLKDKNGKEIYEGDIVQTNYMNAKGWVVWTDGAWDIALPENSFELFLAEEVGVGCEVIGNIHEPPKDFRPEHLKRMGVSISKGGKE